MTVLSLPQDYSERAAARKARLEYIYHTAYQLTDGMQRQRVEALLSRIGTVDWEGEGYASSEGQRDLAIKFHWGHNHRFDDDLKILGRMGDRHLSLAAEFFEGFGLPQGHFKGREVLDIGCWTGGTTLMLKALGAARVVALEEVRKYAEAAQSLARGVYGLEDVEVLPESLYALTEGAFDCVYVPGVVYHLSDPVLALRRMFNRLRDGGDIFVESAGIDHPDTMCWFRGNRRQHASGSAAELNRGGWAWFWPSPSCLALWLNEAGFDEVRVFLSTGNRVFGHARRTEFREITRAGLSVPDVE